MGVSQSLVRDIMSNEKDIRRFAERQHRVSKEARKIIGNVDDIYQTLILYLMSRNIDLSNYPELDKKRILLYKCKHGMISTMIRELNSKKAGRPLVESTTDCTGMEFLNGWVDKIDNYSRTHELELKEYIQSILHHLPSLQRKVVIMMFGLNGQPPLTREEIAKQLGISFVKVKKLSSEAKRKLSMEENTYGIGISGRMPSRRWLRGIQW